MSHEALSKQFQQLDMLRPARDLVDPTKVLPGTFRNAIINPERLKSAWGERLQEAQQTRNGSGRSTLQEHIKTHGIHTPVVLRDSAGGLESIVDGHHRTAVAHDISPNYLVPVEHFR